MTFNKIKHLVILGLGSNIEPRVAFINEAIAEIKVAYQGENIIYSSLYESEPVGFQSATNFINMCMMIKTSKSALELLHLNKNIEQKLGRSVKKGDIYESRTIDIDILYFDQEVIKNSELIIPHSKLEKRKFVLIPLNQIAKDFIHPVFNKSNEQLLDECKDENQVILLENRN